MSSPRVPVGPASLGSSASTAGRLMWATSAAGARPASSETAASARRRPTRVCDFHRPHAETSPPGLPLSLPVFSSASNQQLAGRRTLDRQSRKISMIHLPSIRTRSKHPRADGDRALVSGQGGGTGRREAVGPWREAARPSAASRFPSDARSGTSVSSVSPPAVGLIRPLTGL